MKVPSIDDLDKALDFFMKLLQIGYISTRRRDRAFDQIVDPLFKALEPIAENYYLMIHEAFEAVGRQANPNLSEILWDLTKKRANIVLARNKVISMMSSYEQGSLEINPEIENNFGQVLSIIKSDNNALERFDEAAGEFVLSVNSYFASTRSDFERQPQRGSAASSMINDIASKISRLEKTPQMYEECRGELRDNFGRTLFSLEESWKEVSKTYGVLKRLRNE